MCHFSHAHTHASASFSPTENLRSAEVKVFDAKETVNSLPFLNCERTAPTP